jgi:hypothetical protein
MLASCSENAVETTANPGTQSVVLVGMVQRDGSSTVFPISEAVAEEFGAVAPMVRVTVSVSGTGGGFKKFINQEIDISDASRSIKTSEIDKVTAAGIESIELPIAYDGISVVVSLENDWVDHLTVAELTRSGSLTARSLLGKMCVSDGLPKKFVSTVRALTLVPLIISPALSGIFATFVLAVSRAIGETVAATLAAGATPNLTLNPLESIQTMTAYVVQVSLGDTPSGGLAYKTLFVVASLLFTITLIMNLLANKVMRKFQEVYD